jgi:DNA-binding response OmpR family regulator
MKNILIAEDDNNFGMMLTVFLEMNDFKVTLAQNGEEAPQKIKHQKFDLCILDIMMPLLDGFTVAETISKSFSETPFVFLSAKALKEDQVKGYQLGASDYLIKPFDPKILLLKIKVLFQNKGVFDKNDSHFKIRNFEFEYSKRLSHLGTQKEKLSLKEAELLKLLCEKQGEILTHEEALLKIWKNDDYFSKQSMNVYITKLRKHLQKDTQNSVEIENLHSRGFMLKV